MAKSPPSDIELTQADVYTMIEALNGYIHMEKNCAGHVQPKFFKLLEKALEQVS